MAWSSDPARYRTNISHNPFELSPSAKPGLLQGGALRLKISDKLSTDSRRMSGGVLMTLMAFAEEGSEKQSRRSSKRLILPSDCTNWPSGAADSAGKRN